MCELALRQRRHIDSWGLQGSTVTARAPAVAATPGAGGSGSARPERCAAWPAAGSRGAWQVLKRVCALAGRPRTCRGAQAWPAGLDGGPGGGGGAAAARLGRAGRARARRAPAAAGRGRARDGAHGVGAGARAALRRRAGGALSPQASSAAAPAVTAWRRQRRGWRACGPLHRRRHSLRSPAPGRLLAAARAAVPACPARRPDGGAGA